MAIKTSTFGGVTLTGDAAKAFRKQFIDNPAMPSKAALASAREGRKLFKELKKNGYIKLDPKEI